MSGRFKVLLLIFVLVLIAGCAAREVKSPSLLPTALQDILDRISRPGPERPKVFKATADVTVILPDKNRYSRRVAIVAKDPSFLRMETVPVFGCADFFLSLNKDRFAVFFPGEEKFYTGKTTDENPFALLKIPVPAGDIVPILTGNVRSIVSDESLKIEGCVEEDLYRIDAFSENGEIRSLWIEPSSFNVVRMEVKKSGLISCIASFENYVCEKHMAYPKEVRIVVRGPEYALVEVKYLTAKISDDDEDAKLFELQSPPGIVPTVIE